MTTLARGEGLTRDDLDALPEDGRRHELIDGVIVMSAAPSTRHQDVVRLLTRALEDACPRDLKPLFAPFDVALSARTVIQPDIVVARRRNLTKRDLPVAPVLAVEVLSPSTRVVDRELKSRTLAAAGCPSYWLVDPGVRTPPTLTVLELVDGSYVEVARVSGDRAWTAERPFPVTVVPAELLDD